MRFKTVLQSMCVVAFTLAGTTLAEAPAAKKPAFTLKGDPVKGEAKFKQMCAACHGEKGDGQGSAAAALNPKPASFTDPKRAAEITDEYVVGMIREGGQANGRSPLMVPWKDAMSEADLLDVATYVRSLAPKPAGKSAAKPKKG